MTLTCTCVVFFNHISSFRTWCIWNSVSLTAAFKVRLSPAQKFKAAFWYGILLEFRIDFCFCNGEVNMSHLPGDSRMVFFKALMWVKLLETVWSRLSASQHAFWCLLVEAEDALVYVAGVDQGWLRSKHQSATPRQQFLRLTWSHFMLRLSRLQWQMCLAYAQLGARVDRCNRSGCSYVDRDLNNINSRNLSWFSHHFRWFCCCRSPYLYSCLVAFDSYFTEENNGAGCLKSKDWHIYISIQSDLMSTFSMELELSCVCNLCAIISDEHCIIIRLFAGVSLVQAECSSVKHCFSKGHIEKKVKNVLSGRNLRKEQKVSEWALRRSCSGAFKGFRIGCNVIGLSDFYIFSPLQIKWLKFFP